jgi:hypothetical protein
LDIVEELLNAGAELDAIGMYSSTALMLATKNNYFGIYLNIYPCALTEASRTEKSPSLNPSLGLSPSLSIGLSPSLSLSLRDDISKVRT